MTLDDELMDNARDGNLDKVRDLLQRGANVNAKNVHGDTALILASLNDHLEVVRALLNHEGVDVNIKNNGGSTALIWASVKGHLEVVRVLLNHDGVYVNAKDKDGDTALIVASMKGHVEVVRALLMHNGVDVNIKRIAGDTALISASYYGYLEVVRALLNHDGADVNIMDDDGETALDHARNQKEDDVARLLEEHMEREKLRRENERNPHKKPEAETPVSEEKRPSSSDVALEKDQKLLLHVMNTPSADPAELSLEYIKRCIKKDSDGKPIKLGSGAFGDVVLAEDSRLPKKFAVKMISPTHRDEAAINEIRKTFQKELLTLKKFRHPNIIVLYGYSLNANRTQQCLVYEYATNGSLAGFLTDDGNRARLSADTRLSIMFKLVRAVHFLHTGGCKVAGKGWKVFHRDIKSANICLADDFTPRLIDCGLAKFVPDDNSSAVPGLSTSRDGAFGTAGCMCPEYVRRKSEGASCPYIAAYDVYSIGVVMVELIVGCVTRGQSTTNGLQFDNAFRRYVQDERGRLIVNGWQMLKRDADPTITWNPASLDIFCKAAIQCMAPFPDDRLSTKDLLDKLRDAIRLYSNAGIPRPDGVRSVSIFSFFLLACYLYLVFSPDFPFANFLIIGVTIFAILGSHVTEGRRIETSPCEYCDICHKYRMDIKCSEGHLLCAACIVDRLGDDSGCDFLCLIKECSSHPFKDEDLYGLIPRETYDRYVKKRDDQTKLDECLRLLSLVRSDFCVVKVGVEHTQDLLQKQQHMIQRLAKGLNRSLAALALLSSNQFKECPNLVWLNPISVDKNDRYTPKMWIRDKVLQRYSVVFICAHSGERGHEAFEIEVPRRWIVKVAPWLKLCLQAIKAIANSQALPFPIPNLPFLDQFELMKTFLDSEIENASTAVLAHCEALLENGTMSTIEASGQMQTLAGDSLKFIAEKARANTNWKSSMVPVCRHNGTPIWVKSTYEAYYEV